MIVNIRFTFTFVKRFCGVTAVLRLAYEQIMLSSHVVPLRSAKDPKRRFLLGYKNESVGLSQKRLAGRRVLRPAVDLNAYICRAVIDWVSVTFELGRPSQFRHVQDILLPNTGRRAHVEPLTAGPGGTSDTFTVIVQEATMEVLENCRAALALEYGLTARPVVNQVEVSVDFTPKVPSDDARAKMTAVLWRHLFTGRKVFDRLSTRPRYSWGSKRRQNSAILNRSDVALDDGDVLLNPAGDSPVPSDATFYIGHRDVGPQGRLDGPVDCRAGCHEHCSVRQARRDEHRSDGEARRDHHRPNGQEVGRRDQADCQRRQLTSQDPDPGS